VDDVVCVEKAKTMSAALLLGAELGRRPRRARSGSRRGRLALDRQQRRVGRQDDDV